MALRKERESDPLVQLAELERALQAERLPRAIVLRGEERWFRETAFDKVRARALALGLEALQSDALDPDFDLNGLITDLRGGSLFGGTRWIAVRNADQGELLKKDAPLARALLDFLERGGEDCLLLSATSLRADNAVAKAVAAKAGLLLNCRRLWDSPPPWKPDPLATELVQWLLGRARLRKIPLAPRDALYLAAATGNDLYALEGELEKLRLAKGKSVAEVVGWSTGSSPFQLAEWLVRGELVRAANGVAGLFKAGFEEKDGRRTLERGALVPILLGALQRQVRQGLAASEALARGADPLAACAAIGLTVNARFDADFAARVAERSFERWRSMALELAELERRSRTGSSLDEHDFMLLALRWARPARPLAGARR